MKRILPLASMILLLLSAACACMASMTLTEPSARQVFQRNDKDYAMVPIVGTIDAKASKIEARILVMPDGSGRSVEWRKMKARVADGAFSGDLEVEAGGWYRIEIRAVDGREIVASAAVEKVGVGEVFVTAGQSNSTNFGADKMSPEEDRVSAWNGKGWQPAVDPQPIATDDGAQGGSLWPVLGDLLVQKLNVPVGFISVGWGGSAVSQWNPDGKYYPRMRTALAYLGKHGERAVLWHQGETDMVLGTSAAEYMRLLHGLIDQSRKDAGWDVPWVVAGVSFMPSATFGAGLGPKMAAIREAQRRIADGKTIFEGPTTDDMVGPDWRKDTVHFNSKGLHEHARRWADVLMRTFFRRHE